VEQDLGVDRDAGGEGGVDAGYDGGVDAGPPLRVEVEVVDDAPCADWEVVPLWEPPASTGEVPELLWVFDPSEDPLARETLATGFSGGWYAYPNKVSLSRLGHVWMVGPEQGTVSVLDERGRLMEVHRPEGSGAAAFHASIERAVVVAPDGSARAARSNPDNYLRFLWNAAERRYVLHQQDLAYVSGLRLTEALQEGEQPEIALGPGGRALLSLRNMVTEACETDTPAARVMRRFRYFHGDVPTWVTVLAVEPDGSFWLRYMVAAREYSAWVSADGVPIRQDTEGAWLYSVGRAGRGLGRRDEVSRTHIAELVDDGGSARRLMTVPDDLEYPLGRLAFDPLGGVWRYVAGGFERYGPDGARVTIAVPDPAWRTPVFGADGSRLIAHPVAPPPADGGPLAWAIHEMLRVAPDGRVLWRHSLAVEPTRTCAGEALLGRQGVLVCRISPRIPWIGTAYAAWRLDVRAATDFTHAYLGESTPYRNSWAGSP
jgi:hypothetical protein